jgi:hypothetical protein
MYSIFFVAQDLLKDKRMEVGPMSYRWSSFEIAAPQREANMKMAHLTLRSMAGIAGLAAALLVGSVTGAHAAPTTYTVSGDLYFAVGVTDYSMSGTFTYDPTGADTLDVTLTSVTPTAGNVLAWHGSAAYNATTMVFYDTQFGDSDVLYLDLGSDLTALPSTETITGATIVCGYACSNSTISASADATSAPEPGSLALLGTGLTFIPLTGRSRFRRAVASAQRLFCQRFDVARRA